MPRNIGDGTANGTERRAFWSQNTDTCTCYNSDDTSASQKYTVGTKNTITHHSEVQVLHWKKSKKLFVAMTRANMY